MTPNPSRDYPCPRDRIVTGWAPKPIRRAWRHKATDPDGHIVVERGRPVPMYTIEYRDVTTNTFRVWW